MVRKLEKWTSIVQQKGLDLARPVNIVSAGEIKRITNEEPRLMASIQTKDALPTIFRQHEVFLLPVSIDKYVIVRGEGYHKLEDPGPPRKFQARYPFSMTMLAYGSGENRFLLQAFHSGLLNHFAGVPVLCDAAGGKMRTGDFDFRVDGSPTIAVRGAQMEIDKAYESPSDVLLFEAKSSRRRDFLIRQLYYPYRVASNLTRKHVRAFFMIAEPEDETYNLWEYQWRDPSDYEGIELVNAGSYLVEDVPPPLEAFEAVEPEQSLGIVPQANDFQKVADFPRLVNQNVDTARKWSDFYGIDVRQASYYRQAAEALGLVTSDAGVYTLTKEGRTYVRLDSQQGADFLVERLLKVSLLNETFHRVIDSQSNGVGQSEIARLIAKSSKLTGSTLPRRASTVFAYFKWMARATGAVLIREGRIFPRL